MSFSATNRDPLTSQLVGALAPHANVRHFSWKTALIGRYDILNVHWPDHLTKRHGPLSTVARRLLYALLLLRLRLGRARLVRTLHNLSPHEGRSGTELALLRLTDRWTDLFITMQPDPPAVLSAPVRHIPQGHYRPLYDAFPSAPTVPGRLLFFGIVRGYKGVPGLLTAFRGVQDPALSLRVVGRAFDEALGREVLRGASEDDRVGVALDWIAHEDLAAEVHAAELVVLPYREIFNSGTVIVALSLDRPVLVPRHPTTEALAAEVGAGWVHLYDGELTAGSLADAVERTRTETRSERPNLSTRDWDAIARAYALTFEEAADGRRTH